MGKERKYQLSGKELQELTRAMHNDGRVELVQRASALRQLHLGATPQEVAERLAVSKAAVYRWWRCWKAGGLEALSNRPRAGRPPKADAAYWQQLDDVLDTNPQTYGYSFTVWTTTRLRNHLEQVTGIRLSSEWLRVQMQKRGYVYRRPKADLRVMQNAQARAEAEALLTQLKKTHSPGPSNWSIWTR